MNWRLGWTVVSESVWAFIADDVLSHAAGVAFYTALGLAPAVMLFLSVTAFLGEETKDEMIDQIQSIIGGDGAEAIDIVVRSAEERKTTGRLAAAVGIATVLFSASGIFVQLQTTLNQIWGVKADPEASYWSWLKSRLLSLGMFFSTLFLLLVSLVISTAVALVFPQTGALLNLLNLGVSLLLFIALFALIFKMLPDVKIAWRDVWVGATLTAVLFAIGKYFIGLYLGNSTIASSYGAAGSLVALLVWVYYSAVIVLFGAEVTQVYSRYFGRGIVPSAHSARVDESKSGWKGA